MEEEESQVLHFTGSMDLIMDIRPSSDLPVPSIPNGSAKAWHILDSTICSAYPNIFERPTRNGIGLSAIVLKSTECSCSIKFTKNSTERGAKCPKPVKTAFFTSWSTKESFSFLFAGRKDCFSGTELICNIFSQYLFLNPSSVLYFD